MVVLCGGWARCSIWPAQFCYVAAALMTTLTAENMKESSVVRDSNLSHHDRSVFAHRARREMQGVSSFSVSLREL